MKKFMTVLLFVLLNSVSSHQSLAMIGDVPDEMVLLSESFGFVQDHCKQCLNFLKNGISRLRPSGPTKGVLVVSVCALMLAMLATSVHGNDVQLAPDAHSLVKALQDECMSLLSLDTASQNDFQLAETLYHSMSELIDECGSECSLPSDPLFWENLRSCAITLQNKLIANECGDAGIFTQICTGWYQFVSQETLNHALSILKLCSHMLLDSTNAVSELAALLEHNKIV